MLSKYCYTPKRGTAVWMSDSNSSGVDCYCLLLALLDCVVVSVITASVTCIYFCSMGRQRNVWEASASWHKAPPVSHGFLDYTKILVAGRNYYSPRITMETGEDTVKLN